MGHPDGDLNGATNCRVLNKSCPLIIITYVRPYSDYRRRSGRAGWQRSFAAFGARWVSPRRRNAQAMRAVLFAVATVTALEGLRMNKPRTRSHVADVLLSAPRTTEVAPRTKATAVAD